MSQISVEERNALITGASSEIGKAATLALAKVEVDVALVSRSQDKLEAVANAASEVGVKAKANALNLAEVDQVKDNIRAIANDFGAIDILVNNAGMSYTGSLMEILFLLDWQRVINLNRTSIFQCI